MAEPVSARAKPLGSVSFLSRRVFSAQNGARHKPKVCPEPSGNKLSGGHMLLYALMVMW
jgi:hypothetical protein